MTTIAEADVGGPLVKGKPPPLTPHHPPVLHSMRELLYTQGHPPSMTHTKMTTDTIAHFSCCRSLLRRLILVSSRRGRNDRSVRSMTEMTGTIPNAEPRRLALDRGRNDRSVRSDSKNQLKGSPPKWGRKCRSSAGMISQKCTVSQSWADPRSALPRGAESAGFSKLAPHREYPTHLT